MSPRKPFWTTIPRNSMIIFLMGVFFIFSIIGFASDITQMGRQSAVRLALGVVISGIFPVFYAISGFVLRKQFWKAMVPIFAIHVVLINVVENLLPALPKPALMAAADIARLQSRLSFDGVAIIIGVAVGYV